MCYIPPEEVTSPQEHWQLIKVLRDGGVWGMSWAFGTWDGEARLACRWNGAEGSPTGFPTGKGGKPVWMMLGREESISVAPALGFVTRIMKCFDGDLTE